MEKLEKFINTHYFLFIFNYRHISCRFLFFCSSLHNPYKGRQHNSCFAAFRYFIHTLHWTIRLIETRFELRNKEKFDHARPCLITSNYFILLISIWYSVIVRLIIKISLMKYIGLYSVDKDTGKCKYKNMTTTALVLNIH